jgi:hypothetical protein
VPAEWLWGGLGFAGVIRCVSRIVDIGCESTGKKSGLKGKGRGQRMKRQDVQAVRRQLQQLEVELRRFKKELLNERAEELENIIRNRAVGSCSARCNMTGGVPLPVRL